MSEQFVILRVLGYKLLTVCRMDPRMTGNQEDTFITNNYKETFLNPLSIEKSGGTTFYKISHSVIVV